MAARANWKGFLKLGELSCPVALYTAASESERIAFHTLNRATGHRVRRQFIDSETGKPVEREEQVKGYEVGQHEYVTFEPEEIASVIPNGDKTLAIDAFLTCNDIDALYFDRPYYLAPTDAVAAEVFELIRSGMAAKKVAAIARTVLFRRVRTLLIRPDDKGMIATTLNYDYEVRSSAEAFEGLSGRKIDPEMLELAKHIITTKKGKFDPAQFHDRYEQALTELVKAKLEGRPLPKAAKLAPTKVVDLMEALRKSAAPQKTASAKKPERQRKAS